MSRNDRNAGFGFSIIELLIVVTVMLLLASMTISVTNSVLESSNLSRGGNMLVDAISKARQLAAAHNRTVEVRLVKMPQFSPDGYNGIEVVSLAPDGTVVSSDRILTLPSGIAISEAGVLSPLIGQMTSGVRPAGSGTGAGAAYRAFRIRPNGTVEPVVSSAQRSDLFLTVVSARMASQTSVPDNYMTVQINPDTASTLAYKP